MEPRTPAHPLFAEALFSIISGSHHDEEFAIAFLFSKLCVFISQEQKKGHCLWQ